jgi:hypothetical protein
MRHISLGLVATILLIIISSVLPGCVTGEPTENINSVFADTLVSISESTLERYSSQVTPLDSQLTEVETKLNKLENIVGPALKWIEDTKETAERENWGGSQVARVSKDLEKLQNDQYRVIKLELLATMISAGIKFEPTILIDNVKTGQVVPYEELRDSLQEQVDTLKKQRQGILQKWDLVKGVGTDVLNQSSNWTIEKLNETTYRISGDGLGWHNGLIGGEWLYDTNSGTSKPSDSNAQALRNLLRGQ